jgi:hypothetical protein
MRKLIVGVVIVAAAVLVPAVPAFAIHDPNVPAGVCSNPDSQAVGHPAADNIDGHLVFSNTVLAEHNNANPSCHFAP